MKIRLIYRPARGADARLARFRQVLLSAQNTRRYRPALEQAGLSSARAVARLSSVEEALYRLPYVDQAEFLGSPDDFHNPAAPAPLPPGPRFLAHPEIRAAVLGAGLGNLEEIRQFRPEAIAAAAETLLQLAEAARSGEIVPRRLRAVVVFTGIAQGALSNEDRETFWRIFDAPVFEQCLGPGGSLVAWECDAHEGLHTVEENAIVERGESSELILTSLTARRHPAIRVVTDFRADLETRTCGCGLPGPLLKGLEKRAGAVRYQYCGV